MYEVLLKGEELFASSPLPGTISKTTFHHKGKVVIN